MCCVIMSSEHLSRTVPREVSCPCSLPPLLIWDYKGESTWSLLQLLCPCFGTCHMFADRLVLKKGIGLCSAPHLQVREMCLALKHWEALSLLSNFVFPRAFLAGCDIMQTLCQVLNGTEWLCMCCCCCRMWYKSWTLKSVPWEQQTLAKLCDRPQLHGKNMKGSWGW